MFPFREPEASSHALPHLQCDRSRSSRISVHGIPDQSFANWIGKAPQMFDAARMAGRGPVTAGNPEATAGSALLEAVEPVVDQVLSTSDGMYPEPVPTEGLSEATPPRDIHAIATQKAPTPDGNAQPVTMQDIESIIRSLLDAKAAETGDVAAGGIPAPAGEEVEHVEPAPDHRLSGGSPSHAASAEAAPDQTLQALSGRGPMTRHSRRRHCRI